MPLTITDMPEELIHIIASYLDIKHLKTLYDTHRYLRIVISRAVRKCDVPNTRFLDSSFYKDISRNLVEVNMCGVWGLSKTSILKSFRTLKCVKTLDVAYTNIGIEDLSDIRKYCPSVIDITIDFKFSMKYNPKMETEYQNLFSHFHKVHLVSDFIGEQFNLAIHFLSTCRYKNITFSHITMEDRDFSEMRRLINTSFFRLAFDHLRIVHYSYFRKYLSYPADHTSAILDFRNLAAIGIEYYDSPYTSEHCLINASPMFVEHLMKQFEGETRIYIESWTKRRVYRLFSSIIVTYHTIIMAWNKETTQFDESFFLNLTKQLNTYTVAYRTTQRRG